MVYCDHCCDNCPTITDPDKGYKCCGTCGKLLDDMVYSEEPNTYYKDTNEESRLAGRVLETIESGYPISRKRNLDKGRDEISQIVNNLPVSGGHTIINKAHCFYQIALDRGFIKGRRTTHVAAACLYIACRQSKKAYLLIDFSDHLQISVYVLGAVFLQLCQVLLLAEQPVIQELVDPSLFIHRFAASLLPKRDNAVSDMALRIVASMKRDWMQTGRKPSGLCGAALYIAALSHRYNYSKADIASVVHVCEATLTKRLIEFENTNSSSLTIEEFLATADEHNQEPVSKRSPMPGERLCKHEGDDFEHFAHGLCEKCYDKFIELSGGLEGGADPPAFQRAEKKRFEAAKRAEEAAAVKEAAVEESLCDTQNSDVENTITPREVIATVQRNAHTMGIRGDKSSTIASEEVNDSVLSKDPEGGGENCEGDVDPESLSDIDDVDWYLHNEEETQRKKIIWEEINREYLQEQAAKEALAAELAARGVVQEAKKKRRRNEDTKSSKPAETPAEATYNMLKRKGLGSKVSEGALGELYKTLDEDGSVNEKGEMDFEAQYGLNNADGETLNSDLLCEQTLNEDGSVNEKGEMDFDAQYGLNNADGETFDHGLALMTMAQEATMALMILISSSSICRTPS